MGGWSEGKLPMAIGTGVLAFRIMAAPPRRTVSGNFAEIVWDKTSFSWDGSQQFSGSWEDDYMMSGMWPDWRSEAVESTSWGGGG